MARQWDKFLQRLRLITSGVTKKNSDSWIAAWQEKNLSLWEDADANAHANVDDDDDDGDGDGGDDDDDDDDDEDEDEDDDDDDDDEEEEEDDDDDDGDNGGLAAELVPGFGNPKTTNFFQTGWQFDHFDLLVSRFHQRGLVGSKKCSKTLFFIFLISMEFRG